MRPGLRASVAGRKCFWGSAIHATRRYSQPGFVVTVAGSYPTSTPVDDV